jgi:signal transduction histidine kinase
VAAPLEESDSALAIDGLRVRALLQAVMATSSHLELSEVLRSIAETAAELSGATYSALGVLDAEGVRLSDFITVGIDDAQREIIGHPPRGLGVLGLLITEPQAVRLADLSEHPVSFGFPPGHPPMKTFLGVPIRVRDVVYGNLYLTEKRGGGEFTESDEEIVLALASAAGLAVQNARLYQRAKRREEWLAEASAITSRLLGGATDSDVLPDVVAAARRLGEAHIAVLALPDRDGRLRIEAADGVSADVVLGDVLPPDGMTATVMRDATSVVVADGRVDPRVRRSALQEAGYGPTIYVPLGTAGNVLGTLVVARRAGSQLFDAEVLPVVESFAGQAAIALHLGAAAADREQLAVLGDRDRIARDLHDLVIQRLFATGMALEGALRGMEPPEKADRVRRAVDDLDSTIKEIRTAIFALQVRPQEEKESLRSAVLSICSAGKATLGFEPEVTFRGPVDALVPPEIAASLLAVLREGLSNAARHASATAVTVTVSADPDRVSLVVADNGKGLAADGRRSGLANLAVRAGELNGDFRAETQPAGGTELSWQVPIPQ